MYRKITNFATFVNCELTSRCSKKCWCCGRRLIEKKYPHLANWGDMDFELVKKIAKQLPYGVVVAVHSDGEPTVYPRFGEAVRLFKNQIKVMDTNAILLVKKADEIIDNMDTITISVIENDPLGDEQYEIVKEFLKIKGSKKPLMIYRLLGDVSFVKGGNPERDEKRRKRWYQLPGLIVTRTLHSPMGSFNYEKRITIPEHGMCIEILTHLVIDRYGDVFPCVRFNPLKYNLLGNVKNKKLIDIWNGEERQKLLREHMKGNRQYSKLCKICQYWGIPVA